MNFDFYRSEDPDEALELFDGWDEAVIWGALDGVMGNIYLNADKTAGAVVLGDFAFLSAPELDEKALQPFLRGLQGVIAHDVLLVAKGDAVLDACISLLGSSVTFTRYATEKTRRPFDTERLRGFVRALPTGYVLSPMTAEIWAQIDARGGWLRDFTSNFPSFDVFEEKSALGVFALSGDEIVCGASSYSAFDGGIEIEIGTEESHRRRHLARACAAQLILDCLERGLYPSWDAANLESLHLAQQLGYRFSHTYRGIVLSTREKADERAQAGCDKALEAARALVIGEAVPDMANLSALLFDWLDRVNWLGFYTRDGQDLLLGPFQGKPACIRIAHGRGVCGTALAEKRTLVVPDVHEFPGHIACDAQSWSEIVVPVLKNGEVVAVLDVDSPIPDRFGDREQALLEGVAEVLSASFLS